MHGHGYETIDQFWGKLAPKAGERMTAYTRVNYIKELRSYAEA